MKTIDDVGTAPERIRAREYFGVDVRATTRLGSKNYDDDANATEKLGRLRRPWRKHRGQRLPAVMSAKRENCAWKIKPQLALIGGGGGHGRRKTK